METRQLANYLTPETVVTLIGLFDTEADHYLKMGFIVCHNAVRQARQDLYDALEANVGLHEAKRMTSGE